MSQTNDAVGFYWSEKYGHRYCVVIIDRGRHEWVKSERSIGRGKVKRTWCREYHANTVRELRQQARPYVLRRGVGALCLSKIHSKVVQFMKKPPYKPFVEEVGDALASVPLAEIADRVSFAIDTAVTEAAKTPFGEPYKCALEVLRTGGPPNLERTT